MDSLVVFHPNIDDDPADFTRLEQEAQTALDRVVGDTIIKRNGYAGFQVTKTGPTTISMETGRLYSAGRRYVQSQVFIKDFQTALPLAGKRIVAIVTNGVEEFTENRPRQFLINAETLQSEAQSVNMIKARLANVNVQTGEPAPDPTPPIVDAPYLVIAYVTLSTSGVDTILMIEENRVPNLDDQRLEFNDLTGAFAEMRPRISTLESDLAALANNLRGGVSGEAFIRSMLRLAVLEAKAGIPSTAQDSRANYYLDTTQTDLAHPLSSVRIEEGIRFPYAAQGDTVMAVFDPLNPRHMVKNGMLFPAYDRKVHLDTGYPSGEVRISSFSYQTHNMKRRTVSRQRIRYGEEFTVCSNSWFWATGSIDYFNWTFNRGGETFKIQQQFVIDAGQNVGSLHGVIRLQKYWTDTVEEVYWDRLEVDHIVSGAQIAETWLQGQDMWLDAFGLFFTRLAATGDVDVSVVEANSLGLPDVTKVIGTTTLLRANMLAGAETVVPFGPTFLSAGKRYALLITTGADHWMSTVPGENFTKGTFFSILDGAYAQGDGTRDLQMKLYRAQFRAARTVIELQGLQLVGGILSIDILASMVVSGSTTLDFEVQVGGVWHALSAVDVYVLGAGGSIPPLLPFRAVFNGSADMMPMVQLLDSRVRVSRPATVLREISALVTAPAPTTQVRATYRLERFDPAFHTVTARLMTGGPGYTTETAPTSFTDVIDPLTGDRERTFVWNLGAAVTTYKFSLAGTTTSNLRIFHGAFRKDYML